MPRPASWRSVGSHFRQHPLQPIQLGHRKGHRAELLLDFPPKDERPLIEQHVTALTVDIREEHGLDESMIEHLVTRFEAARLDHHQRELRRREEAAITRLGEKALGDGGGARSGRLASLSSDAAAIRRRLDAIPAEQGTNSATARERRAALEERLSHIHLTAGRLALAMTPKVST